MATLERIYVPDEDKGLVLIFIHGLGGDPHETWMHDAKDKSTLWPRWVAEDCNCTTWTLGYDASLSAWKGNAMPLPDQGDTVLDCLNSEPGLKNRRLLLIGHSLGGLVIKTVINHGQTKGVSRYRELIKQICGVVFIACPHKGSHLAYLASALSFILRTNPQVGDLNIHDAYLRTLHQQFLAYQQESKVSVRTYAETKGVVIGKRFFGFLNIRKLIVDPDSAESHVQGEIAIPLPEDHFSICKPKGRGWQIHKSLIQFINGVNKSNFPPQESNGKKHIEDLSKTSEDEAYLVDFGNNNTIGNDIYLNDSNDNLYLRYKDVIHKDLQNALVEPLPIIKDDVDTFLIKIKRAIKFLNDRLTHTGSLYEELKNSVTFKPEYIEYIQMVKNIFDFERKMFSNMQIDLELLNFNISFNKERFRLWQTILLKADQECQQVKDNFSDDGFYEHTPPSIREDIFKKLVILHFILIKTLGEYKKYLPDRTVQDLDELYKDFKNSSFVTPSDIRSSSVKDDFFVLFNQSEAPLRKKHNSSLIQENSSVTRSVFISYNHKDSDVANILKDSLNEEGIDVIIDEEDIESGDGIGDFIKKSIRITDITLSIVSRKSLLSFWVAEETITTFFKENISGEMNFIACFSDKELMEELYNEPGNLQYNLGLTLNKRIEELSSNIKRNIGIGQNVEGLAREQKRLNSLKNGLDDIIMKLKEFKTEDVHDEENIKLSVQNIVKAIKNLK